MSQPRLFLVDVIDAEGADPSDVRSRLRALEAAGCSAQAVAVNRRADQHAAHPDAPLHAHRIPSIRCAAELKPALKGFSPDHFIVASAAPGGGDVGSWLPAGASARWWPTGIGDTAASDSDGARAGSLQCLGAPDGASRQRAVDGLAGLEWALIDEPKVRRGRLGLWDGDYVLAPAALEGAAGESAIRAFARVAEDWDSLDLVVLADPQPEFQELASRCGAGTRVHFAGASPREAEHSWASHSAAVLIGRTTALAGGLILRLLAAGCPIVAPGSNGASALTREWIEREGCAPASLGDGADALCAALECALDRDDPVERAIEHGRAVAAKHRVEAFAPRLTEALGRPSGGRRAAA